MLMLLLLGVTGHFLNRDTVAVNSMSFINEPNRVHFLQTGRGGVRVMLLFPLSVVLSAVFFLCLSTE